MKRFMKFLFDSDSEISSLSEDSSSGKSFIEPHEEILSETNEEIIIKEIEEGAVAAERRGHVC